MSLTRWVSQSSSDHSDHLSHCCLWHCNILWPTSLTNYNQKRQQTPASIHPYIVCSTYPCRDAGSAEANPSWSRLRAGYTPNNSPVYCRAKCRQTKHMPSHPHLHAIQKSQITRLCMFFDCGRKPEKPERTDITGRTCKLHLLIERHEVTTYMFGFVKLFGLFIPDQCDHNM